MATKKNNRKVADRDDFEQTTRLIYNLTAERLRARKSELNLTYYQIAGYPDQKHYEEAPRSERPVDKDILSSIMNAHISNKKTRYLIPSGNSEYYYNAFIEKLGFENEHEVLWGSESEIQENLPELFRYLYEDSLNCSILKVRNVFSDLLDVAASVESGDSLDAIYEMVNSDFYQEWISFTKATKAANEIGTIVGLEKEIPIADTMNEEDFDGTVLDEYLGFKKLNVAIRDFAEERMVPLITRVTIDYLSRE
jgi:hypothetical protein